MLAELVREQGCTTVIVSHDPESTRIADRIVRIRDGRVSEEWGRDDESSDTIVVGRGGWLRLPEELLLRAGIGERAVAHFAAGAVVVTPTSNSRLQAPPDAAPAPEAVARPLSNSVLQAVAVARGLTRRYGETTVLDGLEASFQGGQLHAVTGPSGSGKTTLLHLLAGLELPDAGDRDSERRRADLARPHRPGGTPPRADRLRRPAGRPRPASVRARERRARRSRSAAEADGQRRGARGARRGGALGAGDAAGRAGCHRASGRASRSPAPSRRGRRCCSPTSRRRASTVRTRSRSRSCSRDLARETGAAVVCATHDPLVIEQADSQSSLSRVAPPFGGGDIDPGKADPCLGSAVATLDLRQSTIFSRLRGLLEVTRLVRTGEELPELLSAIARTASDSLAFRTVVINLYRREWDDFVVTTVYGSDEAREALLGQVRQVADWEPLLDERFLLRGAYLVPQGEFDWSEHEAFTPDLPVSDDPNAGTPTTRSSRRCVPATASCSASSRSTSRSPAASRAVTRSTCWSRSREHAAIAVQAAQEAARCEGEPRGARTIARRLHATERDVGHERAPPTACATRSPMRSASTRSRSSSWTRPTASITRSQPSASATARTSASSLTADELEQLLQPEFDIAGCFLAAPRTRAQAAAGAAGRLPLAARRPRPERVAEPLALRAAAGPARPAHRLHLGRRPGRPPAPRRRAAADPSRVRESGRPPPSSRLRSSRRSRTHTSTTAR